MNNDPKYINIEINVIFENGLKAKITGHSVELSESAYPRQIDFIHSLNILIKDYLKKAKGIDKEE